MKILIPPSEGKSKFDISNIEFIKTKNLFLDEIKKILEILSSVKNEELVKIYGAPIDKSELIHNDNLNILNNKCSQAIERYTGVVYNNFDFKSLDESSKKFAVDKILITSGFLGLVKLNDLIPNYKLKMNSLKLSAFWKPIFSNYLKDEDFILDLLPAIHKKSYESKNSIEIDFKFIKNNKSISAGHNGKAIKGKFIRFVVENKLEKLDEIIEFKQDGFAWDGKHFVKNI